MNQKKFIKILSIIILLFIISIYFIFIKKIFKSTPIQNEVSIPVQTTQSEQSIEYSNIQYGFSVSLPLGWKGYSIVSKNWEGNIIDTQNNSNIKGPEILIRHPLWTSENTRQDIPIMIFTYEQWDLVRQEKLAIGAAPIGPSELGRNTNYVFALPARYNFAYQTGFEEVEKIIEDKSFHAF